jgi:hypothetical protein
MNYFELLCSTCRHDPYHAVVLRGVIGQWRCRCGRVVGLTPRQEAFVLVFVALLKQRELGELPEEQEVEYADRMSSAREGMSEIEEAQLDQIVDAVVTSCVYARRYEGPRFRYVPPVLPRASDKELHRLYKSKGALHGSKKSQVATSES